MKIRMAHLREQGINFAVFAADSQHRTTRARTQLLEELVEKARANDLCIDKAALQYRQGNSINFFGTPDLVRFLKSTGGVHQWTHQIEV